VGAPRLQGRARGAGEGASWQQGTSPTRSRPWDALQRRVPTVPCMVCVAAQDVEGLQAERARRAAIKARRTAKELKEQRELERQAADDEFKRRLVGTERYQQMVAERAAEEARRKAEEDAIREKAEREAEVAAMRRQMEEERAAELARLERQERKLMKVEDDYSKKVARAWKKEAAKESERKTKLALEAKLAASGATAVVVDAEPTSAPPDGAEDDDAELFGGDEEDEAPSPTKAKRVEVQVPDGPVLGKETRCVVVALCCATPCAKPTCRSVIT
jgi:dTMP kinase